MARFGKMAIAGAAAGVTAVSGALVIGSKRIIKMGADLDHMSTQTGVAISSLMKIGQAYKDNGRDAGAAGKDINRMQKAIFDSVHNPGSANDPFARLGISAKELMELSPEQQFFRIAEAINSIENQTEKAGAAMAIFGRSGAGLLTVFAGSNMREINASLGRMPEIMEQFGGAMERVDTLMGRLPNKSDQFFTGFTSGIIGQLLPGLEKANNFDFTTLGENLGKQIGFALEGIKSGELWMAFSLKGAAAIIELGENLTASLSAAYESSLTVLERGFNKHFGKEGSFWDFLGDKFWERGEGKIKWEEKQSERAKKNALDAGYSPLTGGAPVVPDRTFAELYEEAMSGKTGSGAPEELRADADLLLSKMKSRSEKNRREAAEIGMFGTANIPGVGDIDGLMDEVRRITEAVTDPESPISGKGETSDPWRETSAEVNSMQARGLGMGAMFVPKEVKDQVSILREMLAIFKKNANSDKPLTL
jgi:hypothetical protein